MPAASAEKRARQRANKTLGKETTPATLQTPNPTDFKASKGPASPPSPTTIDFATFICIAGFSDIEQFCEAAASTQDGANLKLFWKRAFDEGRKVGYKEGSQMLEGVNVSDLFDQGQILGIRNERKEWETAGHGEACFAKPPSRSEAEIQVNLAPTPLPRIDAAIQTTTHINTSQSITTLSADLCKFDVGTQVELADDPVIPPRLDASIQATEPPPSPSPIPDHTPSVAISSSPVPLNWADDAASLPTKILPSPLPPRDLSDLRSSKSNPFSSLQRRSKNQSSRARQSRRPHSHFNFNSFNSRHHISFTPSRSHSHTKTYPHLNWESDPRLFDLSRSLKALGWIRAY
jgi:hypothetical protein